MSDVADYDTDILLWSERQAAILRDLKARANALPNELDVENLAEEIESVGRSERRAFESHLRLILVHLIKIAANDDRELRRGWASEIATHQFNAMRAQTPSMLERLEPERLWRHAVTEAERDLLKHGEDLPKNLSTAMPVDVRVFLTEDLIEIEPLVRLVAPSDEDS